MHIIRITYKEMLPLDGAGTLINPAYKWLERERQETGDNLVIMNGQLYMYRGGFVYRSFDKDKITKIHDLASGVIADDIQYQRGASHPYTCRYHFPNNTQSGAGYADFSAMLRSFYDYTNQY